MSTKEIHEATFKAKIAEYDNQKTEELQRFDNEVKQEAVSQSFFMEYMKDSNITWGDMKASGDVRFKANKEIEKGIIKKYQDLRETALQEYINTNHALI